MDQRSQSFVGDQENYDMDLFDNDREFAEGNLYPTEFQNYTQQVKLKPDHEKRPIWIAPNFKLYLESFSPLYKTATEFLIGIAEPVCRPMYIHEYMITKYSLYAAVSVGLTKEKIFERLDFLSKNEDIPSDVKAFIELYSSRYGKARLVLKDCKYFIECFDRNTRNNLMQIQQIEQAYRSQLRRNAMIEQRLKEQSERQRVEESAETKALRERITNSNSLIASRPTATSTSGMMLNQQSVEQQELTERFMNLKDEFQVLIDQEMEDVDNGQVDGPAQDGSSRAQRKQDLIFEIDPEQIEGVKEACIKENYPLIEEYDFKRDKTLPDLKIELKSTTQIRPYQEQSLSMMFSNGRARSGVVVLPCGAGKTLAGITAACTIKKSIMVLCTSGVSVEQWRQQFFLWANIGGKVCRFTSKTRDQMFNSQAPDGEAGIVISTYNMIAYQGNRSNETSQLMKAIQNTEWGLLILDEVQVVPAAMFRKVLSICKSHCKLGLTATLVREDEKIDDLNFLIGPKLYEANWLDLQLQGYLARVQCIEVWCEMTPEFYKEYLSARPRLKTNLYVNNPNKFLACQYLINLHESRGDKIIVFSDNLFALKMYAQKLKRPYISGEVGQSERMGILHYFQKTNDINTIFLSKVGDTSIDLPGANVIIQISSHFGARRQEAQRLGRILRPKQSAEKQAYSNSTEFNAYFYSLVSTNTQEMYYSDKRQQFLIDQGYYFEVIQELPFMSGENNKEKEKLLMQSLREQVEFLTQILQNDEAKFESLEEREELLEDDEDQIGIDRLRKRELNSLTGADGMYEEFQR
ncbi:transcription factor iih subunit [Stylonychia lemnae]|uniref:DNA 3'-5' helicase n=1 Tax=Stylonychia lemnae TaxID=5949 RepID=A0A078B0E2_STYLE|nr:transcription factor iih subunit [Stylonychia lemnae]|eukprot:CDW86563.1 transcription factor iih subunit [Stylonychia lemnae]